MALTVDLYPYQEEGVERFLERGHLCLAYDMGLGKTITALAIAEELLGLGHVRRVLIVVPSGLKLQWAIAIATRTDVAKKVITVKGETFEIPEDRYAVVVDGTPAKRRDQYALIDELEPDYVIAGYPTVSAELRTFRRMYPDLVILDEATAIKNPSAEVTKSIRKLWAPYRLALTGTPVDNRLEELYHILSWVNPDILGDFAKFDRSFIKRDVWGNVKSYVNLPILHRKVAPVLMRKKVTDPDVAPYMPKLVHERWTVQMDRRTAEVYRMIAADLAHELSQLPSRSTFDVNAHYQGIDEDTPAGRVMAVHVAGQQLLTDPELLFDSESRYAQELVESGVLDRLPKSAKLRKLEREVDRWLKNADNKIIIVSRFRGMVDRLASRWPDISVTYHGGMSPAAKQAAVQVFQHNPDARILVMSHAGAYGVDLPAANILVNLDPARSAGQRDQINHRHVRSGSRRKTVKVVDLVTEGTIEERDYGRLDLRGRVAGAVVDGRGSDARGRIDNDLESLTAHVSAVLEQF